MKWIEVQPFLATLCSGALAGFLTVKYAASPSEYNASRGTKNTLRRGHIRARGLCYGQDRCRTERICLFQKV
jgi:hypothetical protein